MDLHSDLPFWSIKNGLIRSYPSLHTDKTVDVAIIGAGITGALVGYELAKAGVSVLLTDRRHAGMGSTSASTALLQYEIDTHLIDLQALYGERLARRSYQVCLDAIDKIHELCKEVHIPDEFEFRKSLYYASYKKDVPILEKEYKARREMGIDLEWLDEKEIREKYTFSAPAALLSAKSAQVDPYKLAHQLLGVIQERGGEVHNQTEISTINVQSNGVTLTTQHGHTIRAKYLVVAAGYESQRWLKQPVEQLLSSYAIISEPMEHTDLWLENSIIWETARPYLYMRTTADQRILVGGRDDEFYNPQKRDRQIPKKSKQLEADFARLFPEVRFCTDFRWAGTFAETKDGLPYIGKSPEYDRTFFALGFGGNGITFSTVAADIIRDEILGKSNRDATLFSFKRKPD